MRWPWRSSRRRVRPPRHAPVGCLARAILADRNDSDRHRLPEESKSFLASGLCAAPPGHEVIDELREPPADDLLAAPRGGHGTCRSAVDPGPYDRGVADAARHHERGPARG